MLISLPPSPKTIFLKLVGRWKILFWRFPSFYFLWMTFVHFQVGNLKKKTCHLFLGFAFSSHQSHSNPTHLAGPATATWPSDARIRAPMAWMFRWFGGMDGGVVGTLRISWDPPMEGRMILYYAGVLKMTPAFFWVMIPLRGGTIPETKRKAHGNSQIPGRFYLRWMIWHFHLYQKIRWIGQIFRLLWEVNETDFFQWVEKKMQNIIPRFNKKSLLQSVWQIPMQLTLLFCSCYAAVTNHPRPLKSDTLTLCKKPKNKTKNNASELHRVNDARATVAMFANRRMASHEALKQPISWNSQGYKFPFNTKLSSTRG